jgi:hypothetical protein
MPQNTEWAARADHPRVRGDDNSTGRVALLTPGPPPRARGRQQVEEPHALAPRTPRVFGDNQSASYGPLT